MDLLPLRRHQIVHTTNPDHARDVIGRHFTQHDLMVVDRHGHFDARLHSHRLIDTAISFATYGGEVITRCGPADTYYSVLVPISGVVGLRTRGVTRRLADSTVAVVSPTDDPVEMHWRLGSRLLVLRIEQPAFDAALAEMLGHSARASLRFEPRARAARRARDHLSHRVRAVADAVDRGDAVLSHPQSVAAFERSLMTEILVSLPHNHSAELAEPPPANSDDVRHAIALLESHPEERITLSDLASALNLSGRSLQRAFQTDLDTNFRDVLREIRLRRVRDDLRRASPASTSVREVLTRWGLPSQGYTYATYRTRYGESPGETLAASPCGLR